MWVSEAAAVEEMHLIEVESVPFDNSEGNRDECKEVTIVKFYHNGYSKVDGILQLDQIFELLHSIQAVSAEHKKRFNNSIRRLWSNYIVKLVMVTIREPGPRMGEDVTQLFVGTAHGQRVHRQNSKVYVAGCRYCFIASVFRKLNFCRF